MIRPEREIAACPFCGSGDVRLTFAAGEPDHHPAAVECIDCGAEGATGFGDTAYAGKKDAIRKWNRRSGDRQDVDPPRIVASVDPSGGVEIFGDLPGRSCVHREDEEDGEGQRSSLEISASDCCRSEASWWCPDCGRFYALGEAAFKGIANPSSLAYCPDCPGDVELETEGSAPEDTPDWVGVCKDHGVEGVDDLWPDGDPEAQKGEG